MSIYVLSYDLIRDKNYNKIIKELERLKCFRVLYSVWLCDLNNTPNKVLDHFKEFIDSDDAILIAKVLKKDLKRHRTREGGNDWLENASD